MIDKLLLKKLFQDRSSIRMSIRQNVVLTMVLTTMFSVFLVGWLGYRYHYEAVLEGTVSKLQVVQESKRQQLRHFFDHTYEQVSLLSVDPYVRQGARALSQSFDSVANAPVEEQQYKRLQEFYVSQVIGQFRNKQVADSVLANIDRGIPQHIALQSAYVLDNPEGLFKKHQWEPESGRDGENPYFGEHRRYHSYFRELVHKFGFRDLLLLDANTGDVVYSVRKFPDFATNIFSGPFRDTALAELFKEVRGNKQTGYVKVSDLTPADEAFGAPLLYFATGIHGEKSQKVETVVVASLESAAINELVNSGKQWGAMQLGQTGEVYLIGDGHTLRSNPRLFDVHSEEYIRRMAAMLPEGVVQQLLQHNTTACFQGTDTEATRNVLLNKAGSGQWQNYLGNNVIGVYSPIELYGNRWGIIAEMGEEEALDSVNLLLLTEWGGIIVVLLLLLVVGVPYIDRVMMPVGRLRQTLSGLAEGANVEKLREAGGNGEELQAIRSLNAVIERIRRTADFAKDIGNSRFDTHFEVYGKDDLLGGPLVRMRNKLRKVAETERTQAWVATGIAEFSEILRLDNNDLGELTEELLRKLVDYMGASQGGIFLADTQQKDQLVMEACYAYGRNKHLGKKVSSSDGIIGRCWHEEETIYMTDIPASYPDIKVGLGNISPKGLLVVPVKFSTQMLGVIELISMKHFEAYEIEFVERIAEQLGSAFSVVQNNEQRDRLLKEAQKLTEELRLREEELRQNAEEMQATQEQMNVRNHNMEEEIKRLQQELEELQGEKV